MTPTANDAPINDGLVEIQSENDVALGIGKIAKPLHAVENVVVLRIDIKKDAVATCIETAIDRVAIGQTEFTRSTDPTTDATPTAIGVAYVAHSGNRR